MENSIGITMTGRETETKVIMEFMMNLLDKDTFKMYWEKHGKNIDDNKTYTPKRGIREIGRYSSYRISDILKMDGARRAMILRKYPKLRDKYITKIAMKHE